jgi:CPA2 family monovalent cation:H+ antiporter-2
MENIDLLVDLAYAMAAALLGGFIAHRLRQPAILGYLLAGILVGASTPGPVASAERVQTLANVGVALLMFALGTEFSLEALTKVRNVAIYGGLAQVGLVMALGTVLGTLLGYTLVQSLFLGGVIAISSSILMLKLLAEGDEVESVAGRVALGTSIVQDLSMVALIIVLPALAGGAGWELAGAAGLALLKGGAFLVVAYVVGTRVVPPLLAGVARLGSRELFLLTIVAIAAGTAVLGQVVGISFALGAFVGGLIVSESEFSSHVLDEIIPVRDIFATLFFVSIGMLIDPRFLLDHAGEIALLVIVILLGKLLIAASVIRLFGYSRSVAGRAGLLLAQIGEFSFVMASVGLHRGAIEEKLYDLLLAGALVTLVVNPLLVNNSGLIVDLLGRLVAPMRRFAGRPGRAVADDAIEAQTLPEQLADLKRHVIVCGYGRVGHEVARALSRRNFPFVVIDFNPGKVEEGRDEGFLFIQGDATNPAVLERAGIRAAKLLAVTAPDLPSVEQIIRVGKSINPSVRVLARTHDARTIARLKAAGAYEVIQPEFEAGLEMVRQALRNYGVSALETQSVTGGRRLEHYRGREEMPISEDVF